jgi:hypothetical protein
MTWRNFHTEVSPQKSNLRTKWRPEMCTPLNLLVHTVQEDSIGSHVRYRHLLCGLNNSSKRHIPAGFVKRSGSTHYVLEFLYEKFCCYGKMSVTCNNEKDLVFWSTVHVKYGYLMTRVMRKRKNKSLSVRARLQYQSDRERAMEVLKYSMWYWIPPFLPPPSHKLLYISAFFFFSNMCQDSYCEDSCRFSILRREAKSQLRLQAQVIYFL